MADELAHKELVTSLSGTFKSGKYYDLIVKCKTREWKVHRAIICGRSKFFEKACDGNWMEAKTKTIDLPDDDPENVERMLLYLYTLDYTLGLSPGEIILSRPLVIHAQIYSMADKYDIPSLKLKSSEKFKACLATSTNIWTKSSIAKVLQAVHQSTPQSDHGLRDIVKAGMKRHAAALADNTNVQELVKAGGDFAVDFVRMLAQSLV